MKSEDLDTAILTETTVMLEKASVEANDSGDLEIIDHHVQLAEKTSRNLLSSLRQISCPIVASRIAVDTQNELAIHSASIFSGSKMYAEAIQQLNIQIAIKGKDHPSASRILIEILECYNKWERFDDKTLKVIRDLDQIYCANKQYRDAVNIYEIYFQCRKNDVVKRNEIPYLNRIGDLYVLCEDYGYAIEYFKHALTILLKNASNSQTSSISSLFMKVSDAYGYQKDFRAAVLYKDYAFRLDANTKQSRMDWDGYLKRTSNLVEVKTETVIDIYDVWENMAKWHTGVGLKFEKEGNKIDAEKQFKLAKYIYTKYPTIVGCDAALARC